MKVNKKLLLATLILLIGTNSYSRIYVDNKTTTLTENGNIDKQWTLDKDKNIYEGTGVSIRNNGVLTLDENFDYTLDYTDKNNEGKHKIFDIVNNGTLINNGNISANGNNNLIVDIRGGEFTNNGNINITGEMTGININNSSKAINNGNITITGKGTISKIANGIFENNGTLNILGNDANGLIVSGSNSTAINNENGIINVAGQKANGIKIENGGTGTNKGTINVDKNGEISNKWASGILATGNNSKGTNEGDIFVQGYGGSTSHGLQGQNKGTVINEKAGNIYTNGRFASGITVTTGATGINKGNIHNQNGAQAIRVEGGTSIGINEGNIVSTTSDVDSAAIYLDGGIFINSGTINATHNAIFSDFKKNNSSTVVMNSGSSIKGKILGNDNVNLLYMNGSNNYDNLDIEKYEVLVSRGGDNSINNSKVELVFNNKISETLDKTNNTLESNGTISKDKGNLTLSNSILTIDMKDSNGEKPIIDANKVILDGNMNFVFNSFEAKDSYSLKEALGVDNLEFANNFKPDSTILWDYNTSNGDLTATKKTYRDVVSTTKLNSFLDILESDRSTKFSSTSIFSLIKELEVLKPGQEWYFQNGMTQLSGGIYAYLPDLAILNSRTLVSTMNNRIYQKDFTRGSSVNSSSQDIVYIDNSHRLGGLMNVKYDEKSILGITEKQIDPKSILGFVYGGGNGKVSFENNINGKGTMDLIYFGGYYNHNFTKNFSLNTNLRVNYQHNSIDRYISIGDKNYSFNSTTPTYAIGLGSRGRYSINKNNYSFGIFAGLDWTKVVQGSINEETSTRNNLSVSNVGNPTATSGSADDRVFDSVIPSLGLDFNNTGYIFNKKYSFGGNVAYETELGNIKEGKKIKIKELSSAHYVKSADRENILSYSIFGKLYLTEDLSLSTTYTASKSKEYDADKLTIGSEYKFNSFGGNIFNEFNNVLEKAQNNKHDRWRGTVTFSLESEDDTDRVYIFSQDKRSSGDYKTSTSYIPKIMISLNDTKTKWSYYFEGFYRDNEMLQGLKGNEAEQHATRIHLEARWNDSFSRGRYGVNFGYRNETAEKPSNFGNKTKKFREIKIGVHQFRLTPNFVYKLGKGFNLTGNYANVLKYNYLGDREGQTDFTFENQTGILYDGFMPNVLVRLTYFNETTWLDHNNTSEKYKNTQIRPSLTYYFGNGASLLLEGRISIDGGGFYKQTRNHLIKSEAQESRYGFTYTQPIAPGLNGFVGMNLLIYKNVNKDKNTSAKTHSFRPKVGFNYSF